MAALISDTLKVESIGISSFPDCIQLPINSKSSRLLLAETIRTFLEICHTAVLRNPQNNPQLGKVVTKAPPGFRIFSHSCAGYTAGVSKITLNFLFSARSFWRGSSLLRSKTSSAPRASTRATSFVLQTAVTCSAPKHLAIPTAALPTPPPAPKTRTRWPFCKPPQPRSAFNAVVPSVAEAAATPKDTFSGLRAHSSCGTTKYSEKEPWTVLDLYCRCPKTASPTFKS
mmetsp:Transcript_26117/g.60664  ORF Transcript_26117/g.60664 Transcript_26117/m.60664 type:complete len:228 (+) Transcript_26117:2018-2701(+)